MAKRIYLAVWDHKHGQDVSAHTTENGAAKQCTLWAREALEDWLTREEVDYHENLSDDELLRHWPEISGDTEFFRVDEVQLHEEENEEGSVDTSHIGA